MGAGHSSPSPPVSPTLLEPSPSPPVSRTLLEPATATHLFTVPEYTRWAQMPAAFSLEFGWFYFRGHGWRMKVFPAGLDDDSADSIAFFVTSSLYNEDTRITIQILDKSWDHVVIENHSTGSEHVILDPEKHTNSTGSGLELKPTVRGPYNGYVWLVKRSELEASPCLYNDRFTVRCTVSVDVEVNVETEPPAMESSRSTKGRSLGAEVETESPAMESAIGAVTNFAAGWLGDTPSSSSFSYLPRFCARLNTKAETRVFRVPEFSKCARMPAGTALNFEWFSFNGEDWRIKVYPAGRREDSSDFVAVFAAVCGSSIMYHKKRNTRISIEILDEGGERAVFDNRTARSKLVLIERDPHSGMLEEGYARFVARKELEASSCVHDDSFTVRCTLSADEEVSEWISNLVGEVSVPWTTTSPSSAKPSGQAACPGAETTGLLTPLLSDMR